MVRCVRHNNAECGLCSLKDGVRTYMSSEETLTDWQRQVAEVANARYRQSDRVRPPYGVDGVSVTAEFLFDTPKRGPYGIKPIARTYGDIDKISRTLLDALTVARVYGDDSQVVALNARKRWADDDRGESAGLLCKVESV
jgi:Holliday junction resolvase RusA-like endonuclease